MLQDKVLKLLGDAFEKETVVLVLDNSQIPSVPLYCLLGVSALFGLLGNALTYRMTRHPDLKVSVEEGVIPLSFLLLGSNFPHRVTRHPL